LKSGVYDILFLNRYGPPYIGIMKLGVVNKIHVFAGMFTSKAKSFWNQKIFDNTLVMCNFSGTFHLFISQSVIIYSLSIFVRIGDCESVIICTALLLDTNMSIYFIERIRTVNISPLFISAQTILYARHP